MVTTAILIMWVFLSDGSQTYTTENMATLEDCMNASYKYLHGDHMMESSNGGNATFASGCIVHQQRLS